MKDGDFVADFLRILKDMRGDKDRAPLFRVTFEEILDLSLHDGIEVYERLVDDGNLGIIQKRLRKHQFLAGAA